MAEAQYLPDHIIGEIFLRMPTKPLMQLKCLSKHWNHLISDPNFMKSRSRRMLFLPSLPFHAIDGQDESMIKLFSPSVNPESYEEMTIVGSFNGIILLVLKYRNQYNCHIILYNPLSGEFKTVPDPPSFDSLNTYVYGFGYGTAEEDDLKIVRLKDQSQFINGDSKCFEVFSLKTWSWSMPTELIGDYCCSGSYSGTFANGFLYWNVKRRTNYLPLILSLDMRKMKFSIIEIPDEYWLHRLGTYKGRLCMICSQLDVEGYELRVMNEHVFGKSLSVCSFGSSFTTLIFFGSSFGLLCILDDGKLLTLKSAKKLVIYDMLKDSHKKVNVLTGFLRVGKLQSVEYIESSISPSDICSV